MFAVKCGIDDDLGGKRMDSGKTVSTNKRGEDGLSSYKARSSMMKVLPVI
jgi:hypothetical protein